MIAVNMADPIMEGKVFERRKQVALEKIAESNGKCVPVLIRKASTDRIKTYEKKKYLVPVDITLGQFMVTIRKSIHLPPEEAIFVFIGTVIPSTSAVMGELFELYHKEDMYLYITITDENVYG